MKPSLWNDRGLLLVRAALGLVFVMHGWQKLFVFGHAGVTGFLAQVGVPFPAVNAVLITAAEFGGGLALVAGFQTRLASAVLAFSMSVAIVTVHLAAGFFAPAGVEYPLTLLLVNLALIATGAGAYSVDAWLAGRRHVVPASDLKYAA
jgi:putative oxidoreductase